MSNKPHILVVDDDNRIQKLLKKFQVVRTALQDAASVASLIITTESMITEDPSAKDGALSAPSGGMPGGMGMGGMPGMGF